MKDTRPICSAVACRYQDIDRRNDKSSQRLWITSLVLPFPLQLSETNVTLDGASFAVRGRIAFVLMKHLDGNLVAEEFIDRVENLIKSSCGT